MLGIETKGHIFRVNAINLVTCLSMPNGVDSLNVCLFVCVEVLRPSQPNGVMSSAVSLPNHTFTGQA